MKRSMENKKTFCERTGTHQDANTDDGVQIRKVACDGILRRIEKGNGERAYQDRHIEI